MQHWKDSRDRRRFLAGLGASGALPFLESFAGRRRAQAATPRRLKRLVIVAQAHMALGYHRIPEFARGAYGSADPTLLRTDAANGVRIGAFGNAPGKLGGFYEQGAFKSSPRLQQEMMVVNGLASTYERAFGHQSDSNGQWYGPNGQKGGTNSRSRFPLSGSLHQTMVTIDHVIAKKIHAPGQRIMFMGNHTWGAGGAYTDESVDHNGAIQSLYGNTSTLYNGPIFEGGKRVADAMGKRPAGGSVAPVEPGSPLANLATDRFAALMALRFSQTERKRLLASPRLSANDRETLEKHYELLGDSLRTEESRLAASGSGTSAPSASAQCAALSGHGSDLAAFTKLMTVAFLCDLSRIGLVSVGVYHDHNSVWHAGAGGDPSKLYVFNILANQVAEVAQMLASLTDPETGRDMLETTLVLGITNCALGLNTDNRDNSHSYHDFSYFSVGGSAALNTGFMYDFMGYAAGKRPAVNGPVPVVNQYLQTIAAAYGLGPQDWSPPGGKGFGPWLSQVCHGRTIRNNDTARTTPIPGLLKS
jgi:hypothetical protein